MAEVVPTQRLYQLHIREKTSSASGEVIDELEIGKSVNFRAFLRNSGDEDLTNMQYHVRIYLDEDGTRGILQRTQTEMIYLGQTIMLFVNTMPFFAKKHQLLLEILLEEEN